MKISITTAYLLFFLCSALTGLNAQSAHSFLRKGDKEYKKGNFAQAEDNYRKAREEKKQPQSTFNLGNAIYSQDRFDEAIKHYGEVAEETNDAGLKSNAIYNQGNAFFKKKEYEKSIDAYKNALKLNPADLAAKHNLALAKRYLQQQQQQQQQQKNDKQDQQQDQQQDQKNQPQKDDQNKDKNQQQNQDQQPSSKDKKDKQDQQNADHQKQDLKKEEARKLLQIMDDEERKVQQRLRRKQTRPSKSDKDW